MKIASVFMLACLSSAAAAATPKVDQGAAMMKKVSASFSSVPFDTARSKVKVKLQQLSEKGCEKSGECNYVDGAGVEHFFWDAQQLLVVKSVDAKRFIGKPIKALGIGQARLRSDIVANVKAFLPTAKIICREAHQAGEGEGISSCSAMLGEGWFKILFDADNQLIEARVDAYEFT
jgi:hypothetical protein